jgi:putative Mg2+ transporter-C (MgtC) family protein
MARALARGMPELTHGIPIVESLLRLVLAVVVGGAVGWERERQDKPAGVRTHVLVALGSATFMLLGLDVSERFAELHGHAALDPTRVLQGVVGGIGFLGAGAIIKSSQHVTGMTTAASVWIAGALGASAGLGVYLIAVTSTAFALVTLLLLPHAQKSPPEEPVSDTRVQADSMPPKPPD